MPQTAVAQTAPVAKPYLSVCAWETRRVRCGEERRGRGEVRRSVGEDLEAGSHRHESATYTAMSRGFKFMNPKNTSDAIVVIPAVREAACDVGVRGEAQRGCSRRRNTDPRTVDTETQEGHASDLHELGVLHAHPRERPPLLRRCRREGAQEAVVRS